MPSKDFSSLTTIFWPSPKIPQSFPLAARDCRHCLTCSLASAGRPSSPFHPFVDVQRLSAASSPLASDMRFASREKAILSQWEVGAGLVPGRGPVARLPRLIGRGRVLEALWGADDINGDREELYGCVNRSLSDAELDAFVDRLATRIAPFDKQVIAETKRLVNRYRLPPGAEIAPGWDAFIASPARPQHKPAFAPCLNVAFTNRAMGKPGLAARLDASDRRMRRRRPPAREIPRCHVYGSSTNRELAWRVHLLTDVRYRFPHPPSHAPTESAQTIADR